MRSEMFDLLQNVGIREWACTVVVLQSLFLSFRVHFILVLTFIDKLQAKDKEVQHSSVVHTNSWKTRTAALSE